MRYDFNPHTLAERTADAYSADRFNSWIALCRMLGNRGFNVFEAEAILRSKHTRWAREELGEGAGKRNTSHTLARYLDKHSIVPDCKECNELVLGTFPQFEANADGVPCERGTCPGNPGVGETLVPVGTPLCCNPHSETYWSM